MLSDDHQIELRPKSFAVLRFLVENAGRLISKDEIVQAIWPNVAVTDESLARCISDVRLALADGEQRIIKTVPRRGYLFAAMLSERSAAAGSLQSMRQSTGQQEKERAEARRSAERRQITVMACEVVGLAALSMRLDPEDLHAVTVACHRHCTEIVRQHHGYVAHYLRGSLLVYFGYPDAHENDAEYAVRAGLALVGSGTTLTAVRGADLRLRVGIASGLVVIGDEFAADTAERIVVGETPTLATLLQGVAEADTLVISPTTRRLVSRLFEYRDLGWVALNGLAEPVRAWQVLGPSAIESRFEALRTGATPLVGRDEELQLLMRRWEQAKCGYGSVAMITGEPGIGKSRLVQTLRERIAAEPHIRLQHFCSPHHQDVMLFPAIMQLERAAGFQREDGAEQRLAKLEAVLAQATDELTEAVPLLADLLSIPATDRYPTLSLTPQKRKERTLRALLAQLEGLAARQPVLVVFEGLHWSDPTTRESLDLTIDRLAALRVLLVLTFRPEFAPPWVGRAHATLLNLNRLAPQQSKQMVSGVTSGKLLPEDVIQQIIDRADGIPLFIEELTKAVMESGAFSDTGEPMGPQLTIPTTLHSSLLARLDRLGKARDVAQIAAALGRRFTYELISAVAAMPLPELDDALAQLVGAELVFCRGTPPDAHYTFKHALVQDVAYESLRRSRRAEIHAAVVATCEKTPSFDVEPAVLAHHSAQAGLSAKAAFYYRLAAERSIERAAVTETRRQLQRGLAFAATLPQGLERDELEAELLLALATVLQTTASMSNAEAGQLFRRATDASCSVVRPQLLSRALWGQFTNVLVRGEVVAARAIAEQLLDRAEACGDVHMQLAAQTAMGIALFYQGHFVSARRHLTIQQSILESQSAVGELDWRTITAGPAFLALTLACLGYPERAAIQLDRALDLARRKGTFALAYGMSVAVRVLIVLRDDDALSVHAMRLINLSEEGGFHQFLSQGLCALGWLEMRTGSLEPGLAKLHRGLTGMVDLAVSASLPFYRSLLADMRSVATERLAALDQALELSGRTTDIWFAAELHRRRSELLADPALAETTRKEALAIARAQSAKLFELRAAASLACLWRDQGKRVEARDLLAPIYSWFTEGFDTPDLMEARALLNDLASG